MIRRMDPTLNCPDDPYDTGHISGPVTSKNWKTKKMKGSVNFSGWE